MCLIPVFFFMSQMNMFLSKKNRFNVGSRVWGDLDKFRLKIMNEDDLDTNTRGKIRGSVKNKL